MGFFGLFFLFPFHFFAATKDQKTPHNTSAKNKDNNQKEEEEEIIGNRWKELEGE